MARIYGIFKERIFCIAMNKVGGVNILSLNPVVWIVTSLDDCHAYRGEVINAPSVSPIIEVVPRKG